MKQCEDITAAVDYSSEEATAALKGAGAGAAVVGNCLKLNLSVKFF
jgi:hypothetical protein